MESDDIELRNLRTNRTEMPTNFLYPDKWDEFVNSYLTRGARPIDDYSNKMKEIQQLLLNRFLKARNGTDQDEERKSLNDLLEWLVAYDFSLARIKVRNILKYQTQDLGEDALMSVIVPIIDLTKKLGEGDGLSSNSLIRALYSYEPRENGSFDAHISFRILGAVTDLQQEYYHPGTARNAASDYYDGVKKFFTTYGREPDGDEELHKFLQLTEPKLKLQTVQKRHQAYSMTKEADNVDSGEGEDEWYPFPQPQSSPERVVESNEFFDLVDQIVCKQCTPNQKIVWYLRETLGIGNKEILKQHPELRTENNISKIHERAADKIAAELSKKGYGRK